MLIDLENVASQSKIDNSSPAKEKNLSSKEIAQVKAKDGSINNVPLEALLLLLVVDKTNYVEGEGKKIAVDIEALCKKIKMLDALYKDVLELSEKDGSLDWKKKGLGPSIELLRKEGFEIPAKEGKLPRDERDALLRSLTQQRDDVSTQASQLNLKLNRCYTMRDDHFRYFSGLLSTMNESCKKIFRNVG